MNKKPIYIFLHMPKCAGSTFRAHIQRNLKNNEYLSFYNEKNMHYSKSDVFKKVLSLSSEQKDKLKIIYGHEIFYGLHKYFKRPVRYIVFCRELISRTLSFYNYTMQFSENSKPPFEKWFRDTIWMHNEMIGYFKDYGFIDDFDKKLGHKIDNILEKFWFVGMTENADDNFLFLYSKLGINRFLENQNISKKILTSFTEKEKRMINEFSKEDKILYNEAVKRNQLMKTKRYQQTVVLMRFKRQLYFALSRLKNKIINTK